MTQDDSKQESLLRDRVKPGEWMPEGFERTSNPDGTLDLIYLASPISAPGPSHEVLEREMIVTCVSGMLMKSGWRIVCPASQLSSSQLLRRTVGPNFNWYEYDFSILERCDRFVVLRLPGWDVSEGIRRESLFAAEREIPEEYIEPVYYDDTIHFEFNGRMYYYAW